MAEAGGEQGTYRVAEDIPQRYYDIEHTRMTLEAGWLGKIFGSATNAPTNIAGFILFLFFVSILIVLFLETRMEALEYLKLVLPVITLVLGSTCLARVRKRGDYADLIGDGAGFCNRSRTWNGCLSS